MARKQTPCQKIHSSTARHRRYFADLRALQSKIQAEGDRPQLRTEMTFLKKKLTLTQAEIYRNIDALLNRERGVLLATHSEGTELTPFREGRAWLRTKSGQTYLVNSEGKKLPGFVLAEGDSVVVNFERHRAIIERDGRRYLLSIEGRVLSTEGFEKIQPDYPLYRARREPQRVGLLNTAGEVVTAEWYRAIKRFSRGKALALTQGKQFVFLNEEGRELWDRRFDGAKEFENGLALVAVGSERFYIDETGRRVS